MRAMDWSRTPVGPVSQWPQSLRTAVNILLESGFPMYIAWGPSFTQFYNDGYRPILGSTKHPALGKGTPETFREIWDLIGPMFRGVREGRAVTVTDFLLPLDRHGFVEECYFIFSYSPIRDESGGVGGVYVTVTESTRRVLGARRTATLRDMAARAADAQSEADAWRLGIDALARNGNDVAFVAVHREDAPTPWPVAAALRGETVHVPDAQAVQPGLVGTEWKEPVRAAVALPIQRVRGSAPYGALVVGLSPRLAYDDDYRAFLELAAQQLATSVASARAHEEERRRAEALAEIDRVKTAFFSNVSHEFRTPITLQLGPLEDTLANAQLDPSTRASLEVVHRNTLRLLKLVNSLLDFSRLESGRMDATFAPTELGAATAELASSFRSAIERAGLRYEVDCATMPETHVDRDLWEKAVLNLLSNALKFTFEGGIRVSLRPDGDDAVLEVEDTGVGIAPEELPNVFQRFHRVPGVRARTHEGSGIGLALVQEIAHLHGGSVSVRSEPGRGSTFTLRVPRAHARAKPLAAHAARASTRIRTDAFTAEAGRWLPEAVPTQGEAVTGSRILVVDDNADMRAYLASILGRQHLVSLAADGATALEMLRTTEVDLVLADVMMPGLDGLALLRAARATSHEIPIILVSARAGAEAAAEGMDAGADDYIVKPFSPQELVARVRANLRLAEARRRETRRVQGVLESITDAFIALDRDWRFTYVNRRAKDTFDLLRGSEDDYVGRRLWDLFPEESIPEFAAVYRRTMDEGSPQRAEGYYAPRGRWYEAYSHPSGEGISVYFRDVTARKADEARLRAVSELAISAGLAEDLPQTYEAALRGIDGALGASRSSILLFDAAGVMRFVAQRGLSEEYRRAVEGHTPWRPGDAEATPIVVEDVERDAALAPYLPVLRAERIRALAFVPLLHGGRVLGKFMVYHRDPHVFTPEEVRTAQAIASTVSAAIVRRRAEEGAAVARAETARSEKLSALGSLVSGVAHEIRTPLTIIENHAHLLASRARDPRVPQDVVVRMQEPMEEIFAGIQRATRLVGELSRFTRLGPHRRGEMDLREAVEDAVRLFRATHRGNAPVLADLRAVRPIHGDRAQVQQIVINLLQNAIDATQAGGEVRISLHDEGGCAVLVVEDEGTGMDARTLAHMFEPLFTTKPDGTGLGLSIVKRLLDEHHAEIACASTPGKGTRFTIRFPDA